MKFRKEQLQSCFNYLEFLNKKDMGYIELLQNEKKKTDKDGEPVMGISIEFFFGERESDLRDVETD